MNRRYLIAGRVQGVGFRYYVAREAGRMGLTGWVRNLPDGRVEVDVAGAADLLGQLESALRRGPPHAVVTGVEVSEISEERESHKIFEIR